MQKYRERGVKGPGPTTTCWEVITTYEIGSSGRGVMETIANTGSRGVRVSHQESLDPRANIYTRIRRVAAVVGIASIAASLATQATKPGPEAIAFSLAGGVLWYYGQYRRNR